MADEYISKQRAKDLMGCCLASAKAQYKAEKNEFKKARYGDYISTIQAMIDVVGAVEAADVQPIDRWISVNDKLPEQDEKVLVLTKDKDIMTMIYKVIPFRWYKPKFGGFDKDYVTHWKSLKDGDTE